jgi:hypothetical protein
MAYAPSTTYYDQDATILGSFREKDYGKFFEFSRNDDPDFFVSDTEFPHKIWVGDGWRYGRVLKTVAYIITDEKENGSPHIDKWYIQDYHQYRASV